MCPQLNSGLRWGGDVVVFGVCTCAGAVESVVQIFDGFVVLGKGLAKDDEIMCGKRGAVCDISADDWDGGLGLAVAVSDLGSLVEIRGGEKTEVDIRGGIVEGEPRMGICLLLVARCLNGYENSLNPGYINYTNRL